MTSAVAMLEKPLWFMLELAWLKTIYFLATTCAGNQLYFQWHLCLFVQLLWVVCFVPIQLPFPLCFLARMTACLDLEGGVLSGIDGDNPVMLGLPLQWDDPPCENLLFLFLQIISLLFLFFLNIMLVKFGVLSDMCCTAALLVLEFPFFPQVTSFRAHQNVAQIDMLGSFLL